MRAMGMHTPPCTHTRMHGCAGVSAPGGVSSFRDADQNEQPICAGSQHHHRLVATRRFLASFFCGDSDRSSGVTLAATGGDSGPALDLLCRPTWAARKPCVLQLQWGASVRVAGSGRGRRLGVVWGGAQNTPRKLFCGPRLGGSSAAQGAAIHRFGMGSRIHQASTTMRMHFNP